MSVSSTVVRVVHLLEVIHQEGPYMDQGFRVSRDLPPTRYCSDGDGPPTNKFPDESVEARRGRCIARDDRRHIRAVSSREIYEGYFKFIKIFVFPVVA